MDIARTLKRGGRYAANRLAKRGYYDVPGSYWDDRHAANEDSLVGVGHRSLTELENTEDYEHKWEQLRSLLDTLVSPGATMLDAGCGVGYFSMLFAAEGYRVTGSDFSAEAIAQASAADPDGSVTWVVSALDQLDLGTFDVVVNIDVMYHIVDDDLWERSLRRMADSVSDGGILMIQESLVVPSRLRRLASVPHLRQRGLDDYRAVLGDVNQRRYDMRHERAHKDVIWWSPSR